LVLALSVVVADEVVVRGVERHGGHLLIREVSAWSVEKPHVVKMSEFPGR
jgi:hypothetical protein